MTVPRLDDMTWRDACNILKETGLEPGNDPIVVSWNTYDELVAHIKRSRGKTIYLYASQQGRVERPNMDAYPYEASAHVIVSKPAVLSFLRNAYTGLSVPRDTLIRLGECKNCLFVGTNSYLF